MITITLIITTTTAEHQQNQRGTRRQSRGCSTQRLIWLGTLRRTAVSTSRSSTIIVLKNTIIVETVEDRERPQMPPDAESRWPQVPRVHYGVHQVPKVDRLVQLHCTPGTSEDTVLKGIQNRIGTYVHQGISTPAHWKVWRIHKQIKSVLLLGRQLSRPPTWDCVCPSFSLSSTCHHLLPVIHTQLFSIHQQR